MTIRDGICPNCQSTEIYWQEETDEDNRIRVDWRRTVKPLIYVCTQCGYVQRFIQAEDIDIIREKWEYIHDKPKR